MSGDRDSHSFDDLALGKPSKKSIHKDNKAKIPLEASVSKNCESLLLLPKASIQLGNPRSIFSRPTPTKGEDKKF